MKKQIPLPAAFTAFAALAILALAACGPAKPTVSGPEAAALAAKEEAGKAKEAFLALENELSLFPAGARREGRRGAAATGAVSADGVEARPVSAESGEGREAATGGRRRGEGREAEADQIPVPDFLRGNRPLREDYRAAQAAFDRAEALFAGADFDGAAGEYAAAETLFAALSAEAAKQKPALDAMRKVREAVGETRRMEEESGLAMTLGYDNTFNAEMTGLMRQAMKAFRERDYGAVAGYCAEVPEKAALAQGYIAQKAAAVGAEVEATMADAEAALARVSGAKGQAAYTAAFEQAEEAWSAAQFAREAQNWDEALMESARVIMTARDIEAAWKAAGSPTAAAAAPAANNQAANAASAITAAKKRLDAVSGPDRQTFAAPYKAAGDAYAEAIKAQLAQDWPGVTASLKKTTDNLDQIGRAVQAAADAAKKAEDAAKATAKYKIGDRGPAGGIVFYDKGNNKDGWRYLEAAPEDAEYIPATWKKVRAELYKGGPMEDCFQIPSEEPGWDDRLVAAGRYYSSLYRKPVEAPPADGDTRLAVDKEGRTVAGSDSRPTSTFYFYNQTFSDKGGMGQGPGDGKRNTQIYLEEYQEYAGDLEVTAIAYGPGGTVGFGAHAAEAIYHYRCGGYKDWYIPSIGELTLVYKNLAAKGLGNFGYTYGSSSDMSPWASGYAYPINMKDGTSHGVCSPWYGLRPVRQFDE